MAVIHSTEGAYDKAVSQGVTLVDFWASWCGPCKMLAPVIETLAEQYDGKVRICKVNIDEEKTLASRLGIMSIPTVQIFQDGELKEEIVGFRPMDAYTSCLDALLK